MFLYLVQHAESEKNEKDNSRGITGIGRAATLKIALNLKRMNPDIHVIWHSGKKRALETAEIIGEELGCPNRIMEHTNLAPTDLVEPVFSIMKKNHKNILIVGHLPYLTRLVSMLIIGNQEKSLVKFVNSGIVCLENTNDGWLLRWAMTPEMIK